MSLEWCAWSFWYTCSFSETNTHDEQLHPEKSIQKLDMEQLLETFKVGPARTTYLRLKLLITAPSLADQHIRPHAGIQALHTPSTWQERRSRLLRRSCKGTDQAESECAGEYDCEGAFVETSIEAEWCSLSIDLPDRLNCRQQ